MNLFGERNVGKWLDAFSDSGFNIHTFSQCMVLAPHDNGYRLVLADFKIGEEIKSKLKIFTGTSVISEQPLPNLPSAIVVVNTDRIQPVIPGIAVACDSDILVFRNNKPYYKFGLPQLPISSEETDIWRRLNDSHADDIPKLIESLKTIPYENLTSRSQILAHMPLEESYKFISQYQDVPLQRKTTITCMTTMPRKENASDALSCIIVGTETGDLYIIDPQNFAILHQARICSSTATPTSLSCIGQYEVEFRSIISCRENFIVVLKRGWLEGQILINITEGAIVAMSVISIDLNILVITTNKLLLCYNKKGKKLWSISLPYDPVTLTLVPLLYLSCTLVAIAMEGGLIQFYRDRKLVDTIIAPTTVGAMVFGPLGQEEHVLILLTIDGAILIKILKRTADFSIGILETNASFAEAQNKNLPIPKKSKLFIEQANRERQHAKEIHQIFQQELCRLRLLAAQTNVELLKTNETTAVPLRLSAHIFGLGPTFTLKITITNLNVEKAIHNLELIVHADNSVYNVQSPYNQLPMLVPGFEYLFETKITEKNKSATLDSDGNSIPPEITQNDPIKVFIVRNKSAQPLLATKIYLPISEMNFL